MLAHVAKSFSLFGTSPLAKRAGDFSLSRISPSRSIIGLYVSYFRSEVLDSRSRKRCASISLTFVALANRPAMNAATIAAMAGIDAMAMINQRGCASPEAAAMFTDVEATGPRVQEWQPT